MVVTQPKQFKVKVNGFKEVQKKYLVRLIPFLIIVLAFGYIISHANRNQEEQSTEFELPLTISVFVLVFAFSIYRGLNRTKALYEGFTLTIEPNSIYRDQANMPVIHLYHNEVTQISRLKSGALVIKSADAANLIIIPSQIENKEELEALLNQIRPIDDTPRLTLTQKYPIIFALLLLGLMGLVYTSTNKVLVLAGGILLSSFLIWLFNKGRKNNNIDQRGRRGLWWLLVIFAALVLKVVFTLLGAS